MVNWDLCWYDLFLLLFMGLLCLSCFIVFLWFPPLCMVNWDLCWYDLFLLLIVNFYFILIMYIYLNLYLKFL
jgi:hypothetical protein